MASLTYPLTFPKSPNTIYIDFKYNNLDFAITKDNQISFKRIPCEPTQSLFRLLDPEKNGVPLPDAHPAHWWQAQCAFRRLPIVGSIGSLEWRLKRFLHQEEQRFVETGEVTEFPDLERAAMRALRRFLFGGEWRDLNDEEKFVREPVRFIIERFRDVSAEQNAFEKGYYNYGKIWKSAAKEKAFWFTGKESQAVLEAGMDAFKQYFSGIEEEDPVMVFTRPLGERADCANGKWSGKAWSCDMELPGTPAGDNYTGLKWVQYGFKRGFILATSNRAAEVKIFEIAHWNEMERIKKIRALKLRAQMNGNKSDLNGIKI